jgi:hypothetical protein
MPPVVAGGDDTPSRQPVTATAPEVVPDPDATSVIPEASDPTAVIPEASPDPTTPFQR